jgi:energy-coupling factor transport system permease protein
MAVEFARDITFGQYLDLRSPVHRLDPHAKILATGALMLAVFLARGFAGLLILVLCAVLIQALSRVPPGYTLRGMRLLIGTMVVIAVFQVLFYPDPPAEATFWRWGVLSISQPGLRQAALTFIRVLLLYHLTSTLLFTTALMDLADGVEVMLGPLKRLRVPVNELVMVAVIALKFVPLLVAELERLIKAQTARGARFDRGGLIQRGRKLGALLIPLFVSAFSRAETLTTAMDARCYRGGQGRTKRRVLRFGRADALALAIALLFAASAILISRALSL